MLQTIIAARVILRKRDYNKKKKYKLWNLLNFLIDESIMKTFDLFLTNV